MCSYANRLEVIVEQAGISESSLRKLSPRLEKFSLPVDRLSERFFDKLPRIVLETLYLDSELRVTRLPDGCMLMYVKEAIQL